MHKHTLTWVVILGVIGLMFMRLPLMIARQDSVVNTFSALVEVDALAKQRYVEPISDHRLVDGAIRGMMLQLDPYSGYIAPNELPAFMRRNNGDYVGVGVEIGFKGGHPTIIAPFEASPAARAGVRPGDTIYSVDGQSIKGRSIFDIESMIVGAPGTSVRLRVLHENQQEPVAITIVRQPVSIRTIRGFRRDTNGYSNYWIDPSQKIAYIRVSHFLHNSLRDFEEVLSRLTSEGMRGLIIDLRFNPGGLMHQAIGMVDRFIREGVILSTVTRRQAVEEYHATTHNTLQEVKLAILINSSSASASEIVAGSLQAHHRAVIVGNRSYGKGSVQHLIYLTDHKAAVKLTVAYYRMPDGRIIHRTARNNASDSWGIIPDVQIELRDDEVEQIRQSRRALDYELFDADEPATVKQVIYKNRKHADSSHEIFFDRQLIEALEITRKQINNKRG